MMNVSQRQEFCVRWNSHLGSIGAAFPQLLAGQRFVDVTLACDGHQVHCHRLVLAACSSYFDSLLAENPCKHPIIILPNEVKLWEIQALVDFMYKGEVNVTQAGLPALLRCAEQLRIRGLYGSDAALNLNQLKALCKMTTASNVSGSATNDGTETDDTTTNSTTTTTTTTQSVVPPTQFPDQIAKKEALEMQQQANGTSSSTTQQQNHFHQQQQLQLQLQHQQQLKQEMQNMNAVTSNAPTEDESNDSNSASNEQYEDFPSAIKKEQQPQPSHLDSTVEDDHNYVAAHDEDSYSAVDTEHETSANSSQLQNSLDPTNSFKRVRRSEASLAQAAKCVSKGQTFQTVSNMFNIPVSTIRFYMARKGILPKRKRGRGASNSTATLSSQASASRVAMAQGQLPIKRERAEVNSSPSIETPFQLMGYRMEQGATNIF